MPYYALFSEVVDGFTARRGAYRDEHLRLAREASARAANWSWQTRSLIRCILPAKSYRPQALVHHSFD